MSNNELPAIEVESVRIVFEAPRLALAGEFELDFLAGELASAITSAMRLASRKRSARREEILRLSSALEEFRECLWLLRKTVNPPPPLPTVGPGDKFTPWDQWLITEHFDDLPEQDGRPALHDWHSISKLLAIYQVAFRRQPRGGGSRNGDGTGGPTIRFLDAAIKVGKDAAVANGIVLNGRFWHEKSFTHPYRTGVNWVDHCSS